MPIRPTLASAALALAGCAMTSPPAAPPFVPAPVADLAERVQAVRTAETGFARSMAERDFSTFADFVSEDAVFINFGQPLRGKAAVLAHWKRFFDGPAAPFAWAPRIVEVTADGRLGYSEGPVTLSDGRVTSHYFSTWRLEADGRWRVAFDNGYLLSNPPK